MNVIKEKQLTVIIRLHEFDNLNLLKECLFSLKGCDASDEITVLLVCQNFDGDRTELQSSLSNEVEDFRCLFVEGEGDLRSLLIKRGFEEASTKYVTLLDFDDTTSVYGYRNALTKLEGDPNLGATFGKVVQYKASCKDGCRHVESKSQEYYTNNFRSYLVRNPFPIHACVINRQIVQDLPSMVNTDLVGCEDYWIFFNLISSYRCALLPKDQLMGHYYHYVNATLNTDQSAFYCEKLLKKFDELVSERYQEVYERYPLTRKNRKEWYLAGRKLKKTFIWKNLSVPQKCKAQLGYFAFKAARLFTRKKHR